jgi:hypothetical protein
MTRLIRILVLVSVLVATPLATVRAQETAENAAPEAIPGFAVAQDDATSKFPDGITFSLNAESDNPIADVELMYRVPGLETYSVELPRFEAGATTLDLEQPVDLRSGDLPPGVDVQYHWRVTAENGDVIETPEKTILWKDDRYDWTPLKGPHVTVYSYDGDAAFEQEILDAAERTITSMTKSYGVEPNQEIRLWSYVTKDDLYGALAPNSEPWIAGATYPGLHEIMAILPPGDSDEVKRVVPHEISHQVLHQATENPFNSPPQWMDEGLAVFNQESGRDRFYAHALQLASQGKVPPLRTLNGDFPYDQEGALDAYSLSLSAVIYILDTYGNEGMSRLIKAFPEGVSFDDAIYKGLGITFDELDKQWRADLIADSNRLLGSGTTRFNDSGPGDASPWSSFGQTVALASGTIVLGLVVLFALIAGLITFVRRGRHASDPDPDLATANGVIWRDWPEGLEPPGREAHSPSQP